MKTKIGVMIWLFCTIILHSFAQKNFSEGVITYDVFVDGKPSGTYIVSVKKNNLARQIVMQSGYSNLSIYNAENGTSTTMNIGNGNKYALQLSANEVKQQNIQFENATITNLQDTKTIANYTCKKASVVYTNGMKNEIFYTDELTPTLEYLNMMFPGLQGIPLEYDIKTGNKQSMKFVATSLSITSVDNTVFTIPKEYKLITKEQLEKLK